jgi:uncharacterized membrane protein YoaK (UPF0700 family)
MISNLKKISRALVLMLKSCDPTKNYHRFAVLVTIISMIMAAIFFVLLIKEMHWVQSISLSAVSFFGFSFTIFSCCMKKPDYE